MNVAHCLGTGFSMLRRQDTVAKWRSLWFCEWDCLTQKEHKARQHKGQKPPSEDCRVTEVMYICSALSQLAVLKKKKDMGMRLNCPSVWPPGPRGRYNMGPGPVSLFRGQHRAAPLGLLFLLLFMRADHSQCCSFQSCG